MLNINKNYGFSKAKGDWILNLDADESIDFELKKEISEIIKQNKVMFAAFKIPRKNKLFGKWIRYAGWYPDTQIRLFKKESFNFWKGLPAIGQRHARQLTQCYASFPLRCAVIQFL